MSEAEEDGWTHGQVFWSELNVRNVEQAKAFFAKTLGWQFEGIDMPEGDTYWIAKTDAGTVGGIFDMTGVVREDVPEHWLSYIAVDDVDKRVETAIAAGAEAIRSPFDVQGVGRIAILKEPGGAVVGWMTPSAGEG